MSPACMRQSKCLARNQSGRAEGRIENGNGVRSRGTSSRGEWDYVVLGAEGELGKQLAAVVGHKEDVVLAVSSRALLAYRHCEHWLHADDHPRHQHGLHVLADLKQRL